MSSYRFTHNRMFYAMDLVASLVLLILTLIEAPCDPRLQVDTRIHVSVEIICLTIISIESWMKLRWMGLRSFITHPRTVIKVSCIFVMFIDAALALVIEREDYRVVRALRPVFLIDNHFSYTIRRTLRHTLQSLRPILDIVAILFLVIAVFSLLGFYLFGPFPNDRFFNTFGDSFSNMFVVISNGNFPDILLPVYARHRTSAIFFVVYMVIQMYFVLNMMLAVSYEKYSSVAKEKFRRLFLHRRLCCRHAFNLLTSDANPEGITFKRFEGVVRIIKPGISRLRCYLMFKLCDTTRMGTLTLDQFYRIYDAIELNWSQAYPEIRWYHCLKSQRIKNVLDRLTKFSKSAIFEKVVDSLLVVILLIELVKTSGFFPSLFEPYEVFYTLFIGFYVLEATIKIVGFGFIDYIATGWNPFDFIVTGVSMIGHYIQPWGYSFGYFYLLRTFRILRFFDKTRRYQHIMGPFVFIMFRQMTHFSVIVFVVLFSFSILGMFLFADTDIANPPPSDASTASIDDLYGLHNFQDIQRSFLTLFILSLTYMYAFMIDRYAKLVGPWSRVYFMSFYVISTIVMKIVISSILEAFLFVMKCKRRLTDIEEQTRVSRDISLGEEELEFLALLGSRRKSNISCHTVRARSGSTTSPRSSHTASLITVPVAAIFRGTKLRTKFSFSCKMYDKEIKEWIEEEEANDKLLELCQAGRRRAFSCKV